MNRINEWDYFSKVVRDHIEFYTIFQYGDKGEDLCTEYSPTDCINQVTKYLKRFGKNARSGQDELDMLKAAHYIQMAYTKLVEDRLNKEVPSIDK